MRRELESAKQAPSQLGISSRAGTPSSSQASSRPQTPSNGLSRPQTPSADDHPTPSRSMARTVTSVSAKESRKSELDRQAGTPNPLFAETGLERLLCSPSALQRSDTSVLFEALISERSDSKTQAEIETQIHDFLLVGNQTASDLDGSRSSKKQLFTGLLETGWVHSPTPSPNGNAEAVISRPSERGPDDASFDLSQGHGTLAQRGDLTASSFAADPSILDSRALQLEAVQIRLCQERAFRTRRIPSAMVDAAACYTPYITPHGMQHAQ